MRVAVILAGVVLGWVACSWPIDGFIIEWGCNGSDAGQPPSAGSVGATICDSSAFDAVLLALGLATLVVPMAGAVLAARRCRYAPLLAAAAVAAGAVFALGLVLHAVEEGSEGRHSAESVASARAEPAAAGLTALARVGAADRRQRGFRSGLGMVSTLRMPSSWQKQMSSALTPRAVGLGSSVRLPISISISAAG